MKQNDERHFYCPWCGETFGKEEGLKGHFAENKDCKKMMDFFNQSLKKQGGAK